MNVNEALCMFAVSLLEIKTACFAVKPVNSDGLHPKIFPALVSGYKVACLAAFISRFKCNRIVF